MYYLLKSTLCNNQPITEGFTCDGNGCLDDSYCCTDDYKCVPPKFANLQGYCSLKDPTLSCPNLKCTENKHCCDNWHCDLTDKSKDQWGTCKTHATAEPIDLCNRSCRDNTYCCDNWYCDLTKSTPKDRGWGTCKTNLK